jgi:tetratricopeptide (TPR) repeat protein
MNRHQRRASAKKAGLVLNSAQPNSPAALCASGRRHLQAGQLAEAEICCRQAFSIKADHADSLHLMGEIRLHCHQYDEAVDWVARAIRQAPKAEYLTTLGTALQLLKRFDEALKAFDKAVQFNPDDAELWEKSGQCTHSIGAALRGRIELSACSRS